VIRYDSIKIIIGVEGSFGLPIHQMDVKTEFLNGQLEKEIYMKVTPCSKYEGTGKIYKLVKFTYGLKQSPMIWHKTLDRVPARSAFVKISALLEEDSLWASLDRTIVDYLLIATRDPGEMTKTKNLLVSKFKMIDLGLARKVLGMAIIQSESSIKLDLKDNITNVVKEFGFEDANAADIPTVTGFNLMDDDSAFCTVQWFQVSFSE
jgi:hypothetical protein